MQDVAIEGNIFANCRGGVVFNNNGDGMIVANNIMSGLLSTGIAVNSGSGHIIEGNKITMAAAVAAHAIYLNAGGQHRVIGNRAVATFGAGIFCAVAGCQILGGFASAIMERDGLKQISDTGAIEKIIDEVLTANPKQVEQYKSGKTAVIGFLVGQVMKASRGQANPGTVNDLLKSKLG